MDRDSMITQIEGGLNRRDIAELHPSELGEIVWQHKSGASDQHIATRLRVKKWQVTRYLDRVKQAVPNAELTGGFAATEK